MFEFIKRMRQPKMAAADPEVEHRGFIISARPRQVDGGWSTQAEISRQADGETKRHEFIRADTSPDRKTAAALTVSKAKALIDQQGDQIFKRRVG